MLIHCVVVSKYIIVQFWCLGPYRWNLSLIYCLRQNILANTAKQCMHITYADQTWLPLLRIGALLGCGSIRFLGSETIILSSTRLKWICLFTSRTHTRKLYNICNCIIHGQLYMSKHVLFYRVKYEEKRSSEKE